MSRLLNLQTSFQDFLFGKSSNIHNEIQSLEPSETTERLGIYLNAYELRLIEALLKDFPGLLSLLGDEEFEIAARAYIQRYPSTFTSLRWFGQFFPDFLKSNEPYKDIPMLYEMARFEWALAYVFDALDNPTLVTMEDIKDIKEEAWPSLQLQFISAYEILTHEWNTVFLCEHRLEDNEELNPQGLDAPTSYVIWRSSYQVQCRSLCPIEKTLIEKMATGASFGTLCELLCEWHSEEEVPQKALQYLQTWIAQGLVAFIKK